MTRFLIIFIILIVTLNNLSANNIQVSAPTLTGENRTEGYVYITFDLSWANSWRGTEANNWDAAWVFAKYRVGNGEWKHVKLHNTGHIAGSGTPATIDIGLRDDKQPFEPTGNPGVGVFMYRSAEGFGTFSTTGNKLRWNYTAEGITAGATVEVRVFAIEMVYVREGEFTAGASTYAHYYDYHLTTINTPDARVTATWENRAGGYPVGINNISSQRDVKPEYSDWPNGYKAFYCMKYEVSQQQIVDFFNTLTNEQVNNIRYWVYGQYRYMITQDGPGNITTSLPNVACNQLSTYSSGAYADWACLRPMTELEFEKACRGPLMATPGDFAWGTDGVVSIYNYSPYELSYRDTESEGIASNYSDNLGNAFYSNTNNNGNDFTIYGPLRVGIFAANGANTGRVTSGASYWGIMELSGNLEEICINLDDATGRIYRGNNGDGMLGANGYHNVEGWPLNNGFLARGGSWYQSANEMRVASRYNFYFGYSIYSGFRAVRSPAQ